MLHTRKPCSCPVFPDTRIPDCTCQIPGVSPFLQIRWKRLVVDEGHVSAMVSTALIHFAKLLSVQFRWIVTGTPTTNLLGLSLGKKGNEATQEVNDKPDKSPDNDTLRSLPDWEVDIISQLPSLSPPAESLTPRVWTQYDRLDLQKVGNMMTHFIMVPQFATNTKLVQTHVTEPLLDLSGPRPGSIQVLNQVMETIMIRHRYLLFSMLNKFDATRFVSIGLKTSRKMLCFLLSLMNQFCWILTHMSSSRTMPCRRSSPSMLSTQNAQTRYETHCSSLFYIDIEWYRITCSILR